MASTTFENVEQDEFNLGPVPISDREPSTNLDSLPKTEPIKKPVTSVAPGGTGASPDQSATVLDTYRKELGESFEGLRRRSIGIQEEGQRFIENTKMKIEPIKQDIISTIMDTTDITTPTLAIVHTFGWASILLFNFSVSSILGAYVFGPLIGVFFGKFGAALISAIGFPVYGYYMLKRDELAHLSDSVSRFGLVDLALIQGFVTGFVLSEIYISAQPLAFLFPATIAIVYPFIQKSAGANRVNILISSIGAAFAINLVAGFLTGNLTTVYLLLTILYSAASAIIMQFIFRNVLSTEQRVHLYQLAILSTFVAVKLVIFGIFGGEKVEFQKLN